MIEAFATKAAGKYRLLILGHAENTGEGARVCAAVSALGGALLQYAKTSGACRHVRHTAQPGCLFLSAVGDLSGAFELVAGALSLLSRENPTHMAPFSYTEEFSKSTVNDNMALCLL